MALTIFAPQQIDQIAANLIGDVPKDHHFAVVATIDAKGIPVAVTFTSQDGHWQASAVARHDFDGTNSVGGSVKFSA